MRTGKKFSRRKFIQFAVAAGAAGHATSSCSRNPSPWRFFDVEEAKTLEAISGQIVPADKDPGAAQAGVVNYIDRQLAGHLKRHRRAYREGLTAINQTSRALFGKRFDDLAAERQRRLLAALEKNLVPGGIWSRQSAGGFFDLLVGHTLQGFYGDPRHGGNREGASWKMLGLPYPPIRGRFHYDLTKPPQREAA